MKCISKLGATLGVALLAAVARTAVAGPLEDATALIKAGEAKAAYELLSPLEAERSGEPDYDYLLGLAALDSGRADLAVFALERAVAVQPDNAQYRAELARAFFELREDETAKSEFESVAKLDVPEEVQATIRGYLEAIDSRFASLQPLQWALYAETGGGYDSNVNAATDRANVAIPSLGNANFLLSADGQEQDAVFLTGRFGGRIGYQMTKNLALLGGVNLAKRFNVAENFATGTADINLGLRYQAGRNIWGLNAMGQRYEVDNDLFRSVKGLNAQWIYTIDGRNDVSLFGQLAAIDYYPEANALRDTNLRLLGVGWSHAFTGEGSPTMYLSGYMATEDERNTLAYLGRDYYGVRAGGGYDIRSDLQAFVSATFQISDYGGTEPLFLTSRDDDFLEVSAGVRYRPLKGWTVTPQVRYSRNSSNIPVNDYDRISAWAVVRFDYR